MSGRHDRADPADVHGRMLGDSQRSRGRGEPGGDDRAAPRGTLDSAGGVLGWIAIRVAAVLAVAMVLVATVGFLLQRADGGPVAAWARSTGHDALWMGHAWLDGRRSPADLARLAVGIRASGIRDVYVLAGELGGTGRAARAAYSGVRPFLAGFHAMLPGVRVSAWLRGTTGRGHINLADRATRANIVAAAAAALHAGFGGVHYDLEPVASGDPGLLGLLKATRALHPNPLSVSAPKLEPLSGLRLPAQLTLGRPVFWTTGYLTDVAREVDQVAVRSYDTGMPFRSWYGGYVKRETALALQAVPRRTELLMGLPAYHVNNLAHHAAAETVGAAIHGIRVAITAAGQTRTAPGTSQQQARPGAGGTGRLFGVALFADYSATPRDWASYRRDWVRPV